MVLLPSDEDPAVKHNRNTILVAVTLVLIISNFSYALRIWARKQNGQLGWDDYIMGLALPFSYIPAVCMYYG